MSTAATLRRLKKEFGDLVDRHDRGRDLGDLTRYRDDPVGFIREVLGETDPGPWSVQEEIAGSLVDSALVHVQSCNGAGKDWLSARLALWWVYARQGLCIVSGPTERQIRGVVFGELSTSWTGTGDLPGELYSLALRVPGAGEAIGFASTSASSFTGWHDPNLLVILTEAQGLEDWVYEAALSCAVGSGSKILAVGNPLDPSGPFYNASRSGNWRRFTISAFDHPNLIEGREVIPGAVTKESCERIAATYGNESPQYMSRVLGRFPKASEHSLVSRDWLDAAAAREAKPTGDPVVAVDPARLGGDSTILAVRRGSVVESLIEVPGGDTMQTTGRVIRHVRDVGVRPRKAAVPFREPSRDARGKVIVDATGLGSGIADRLREQGFNVHEFVGARSPRDGNRFANLRAEAYWHLRDDLEAGRLTVPDDEGLFEELLAHRWEVNSSGKILIERKELIRGRLGRSPDRADALSMVCYRATTATAGGASVDL